MKIHFAVSCLLLAGLVVACSGSTGADIPTSSASSSSSSSGSSSGKGSSSGGGGSSGMGSSGMGSSSGIICAPCAEPPPPGCKGQGPCGCTKPYLCTGDDTCTWSKDTNPCGAGKYCQTSSCGPGKCVDIQAREDDVREPQCGCDGVTYWNESVAAKNGMSLRGKGVCGAPLGSAVCGGQTAACPGNARCNLRIGKASQCGAAEKTGTCWMTPAICPPAVAVHSHACASTACTDECNLIKLMTPWYEDVACPN